MVREGSALRRIILLSFVTKCAYLYKYLNNDDLTAMIIIDVQEIGSTGWLTEADGSETKLVYGQRGAEFFYAVDVAPQDDERDYQCWVGPFANSEAMQNAAWATREPETDGQTATVNLPLPSLVRRDGVQP